MNDIEARLLELNEVMFKLAGKDKVDPAVLEQAYRVAAGAHIKPTINTGDGNDTIIINEANENVSQPGPKGDKGDKGDTGEQGPQGEQGEQGPPGEYVRKAILVSQDYAVMLDDYYIGVNSNGPITITLPTEVPDCLEIIVKAEMGPPIGKRKVTIVVQDDVSEHLIDGKLTYVLTQAYESVHLFCRAGNWVII